MIDEDESTLLPIKPNYYENKYMSSFETPFPSILSIAFWVTALLLSPFTSFFMRSYSQGLLIVQLVFIFSYVYASDLTLFADKLEQSWLSFIPSILTYCPKYTYECNNANLLTAIVVWFALIVLLWIIVKLVSIKKPNASFKPVYNFFKGFFRCILIPLTYNSWIAFIVGLQDQDYHRNYYAAITFLLFCGVVILVELIAFKCSEEPEEDSWTKWDEFFSQARVAIVVLFVALSYRSTTLTKYALYGPIVLYDIFHLAKYNYHYKIFQRVVFIIQEAVFITIYSLFIFNAAYIKQYSLDFLSIAVVIVLELFQLISRIYSHCKSGGNSGQVKNQDVETPQINKHTAISKERSTKVSSLLPQNSFAGLDDSLADLKDGQSSPRKKGRGGRLI